MTLYVLCLLPSKHELIGLPLSTDVTIGLQETSYVALEATFPMSVNVCTILSGLTEREVAVNINTTDVTARGKPCRH